MHATVLTSKVIGTVTIGLWAGYNISLVDGIDKQMSNLAGRVCCTTHATARRIIRVLRLDKIPMNFCWACLRSSKKPESRKKASEKAKEPFSPTHALKTLSSGVHASGAAAIALIADLAAFWGAPQSGRHPYLLYLALGAPLVGILQFYGARELSAQLRGSSVSAAGEEEPSLLSDSVYEHIPETVNADAVANKYGIYTGAVAFLSSALYVISVVGLAGDTAV